MLSKATHFVTNDKILLSRENSNFGKLVSAIMSFSALKYLMNFVIRQAAI